MAGGIFLFTGTDLQKAGGRGRQAFRPLRQDLLEAGRAQKPSRTGRPSLCKTSLATYEFLA